MAVTWRSYNIAVLELFPIVLALHMWGHFMADKRVIFFSDNAAVVDIINKQTSKHQSIMLLIRDLVLSCLRYNVLFHAKHIPGFYNTRLAYSTIALHLSAISYAHKVGGFCDPTKSFLIQKLLTALSRQRRSDIFVCPLPDQCCMS